MSVLAPAGWVCQAVRAPGSKVDPSAPAHAGLGLGALKSGSTRTVPVKIRRRGPCPMVCVPLRVMIMRPTWARAGGAGAKGLLIPLCGRWRFLWRPRLLFSSSRRGPASPWWAWWGRRIFGDNGGFNNKRETGGCGHPRGLRGLVAETARPGCLMMPLFGKAGNRASFGQGAALHGPAK